MSMKMTPSGIEPVTLWLVTQCLLCYVVYNDNGANVTFYPSYGFYDSQSNFTPATDDGRLG